MNKLRFLGRLQLLGIAFALVCPMRAGVGLAQSSAPSRVLTLDEAVAEALNRHPTLHAAQANVEVAIARANEIRSGILPQLNASGTYQRSTANYASRPGALPQQISAGGTNNSFDTYNYFNFGLNAAITFDAMQTPFHYLAAKELVRAQQQNEQDARLVVILNVRSAFFNALAQKSQRRVAEEALANTERHLAQIERLVAAGLRPDIDLAQAKTDRANARFQLISAQNAAALALSQLGLAMGVERMGDAEVADEWLKETAEERIALDELAREAEAARPDLASLAYQLRSQDRQILAAYSGFAPSLTLSTGLTDAGADIGRLTWNWNVQVGLSWPLFQGLLTYSQLKEAKANLAGLKAQEYGLKLQLRLDVEQSLRSVGSAKAEVEAASEALQNAKERLRLAEKRYENGLGNIIELSDAQLALTNAAGQHIKADFDLAIARTQLLRATGRL